MSDRNLLPVARLWRATRIVLGAGTSGHGRRHMACGAVAPACLGLIACLHGSLAELKLDAAYEAGVARNTGVADIAR